MDVRVTSTGRIFRRIDTGVAAMLVDALPTVFELANPLPANLAGIHGNVQAPRPAAASEWGLALSQVDRRIIGLQITVAGSGETLVVGGPADGILSRCERALAGRPAPLPSEELIKRYAAATADVAAQQVSR